MLRTVCALSLILGSFLSSCPAASDEPRPPDPILVAVAAYEAEQAALAAPPTPHDLESPAAVPLAPVPVDLVRASVYAMRQLPARDLLRYIMGDRRYEAIAREIPGESGWNCGINNRTSSAAGLGQTLKSQGRIEFLRAHPLGPFTWDDVRGPDCLADALLIDRLYDLCGLGDWTPPYKCLRPLPR